MGLLGSAVWAFIGFGLWVAGPALVQLGEIGMDFTEIETAVQTYEQNNNGTPPPDLATLNLPADTITDPWGTPYRYAVASDGSWTIEIAGPDGDFDSGPTAVLKPNMTDDETEAAVLPLMEQAMRDRFDK